jgi:4-hydroxythreonine-4-phosphate dehydrogenase
MEHGSAHPSATHQPVIGISMGDPAGIGPEVIVKALSDPSIRALGRFVIYGLNEMLAYAADQAEFEPWWFRVPHESERAKRPIRDNVVVFDFDEFDGFLRAKPGASRQGGLASKAFVEAAITDAMLPATDVRHIDALVTGPICKEAWSLAGFRWPGHTELLAHRTKAKRAGMVFISPQLKVALATVHIPLMEIRNVLTIGRVFEAIDLGNQVCLELGIRKPSIAVCGLNPHAGESGQFGDEEARLIEPAINVARHGGIDAHGPFPADTIFSKAISDQRSAISDERLAPGSAGGSNALSTQHSALSARPRFDLVVAMYHDQGLIPVKLLARDEAVNVTAGLPIVRTSPDHGTAFDIAGKNVANPGSMKAAIRLAAQLARNRMNAEQVRAAQTDSAA